MRAAIEGFNSMFEITSQLFYLNIMSILRLVSIFIFWVSLFPMRTFSQSTFFSLNGGLASGLSTQTFGNFYNYTENTDFFTNEQVYVSLGNGFNLGAAIGYMFNNNLGLELGLNYLNGAEAIAKDIYLDGTTDYSISSNILCTNPSLILAAGMQKLNPYAKIGLVIGSGNIEYRIKENVDGDIAEQTLSMNGGLAFGLNASFGLMFKRSEAVSFFTEFSMINMSYAPEKGEITEATFNGRDILPSLTTNDKKFEYLDKIIYTGGPPRDSEPTQSLKVKYPFGSWGLNAGIRLSF